MKKIIIASLAVGLAASSALAVDVTLDLASAYVFRGVTLSDKASFQPGIEVSGFGLAEEYGSVAFGAWAAYDLDDSYTGASSSTFQETDWYVSYGLPTFVEGLDLSLGYCEYAYGAGSSDEELSIGAGYTIAGVGLGATYYQGVGGAISTSAYYELAAGYDLDVTEELVVSLGARVGYADPDGGEAGFSDYDLSAAVSYPLTDVWSIGASATYIGQIDDDVLGDAVEATGTLGYDVDFVGMLSLAASF
ncbi:hypothetical protein [Pontiella agarivorans]|uniref:Outer membrane protein beta-barrel domain-containing protein n=1 Tax=Pontiella agarivorans TaxID=3038953 RepID=A0ABU5MXS8_9BACT|nr:hypothetical protein [Pontiella agarivorans]MDZ8118948.1 hypothetical protein [Pontiella agarivorans]